MNDNLHIRAAKTSDAEALLAIYKPYIENTAITFEYDIPSVDEFANRIKTTLEKYPYIVAELDGKIVGYAYAGIFKGRKAYDWSVETSIYVELINHGNCIGRLLYEKLEEILKMQGITNVNACIAYTEHEDEHLHNDSIHFHKKLGYKTVGIFHKCAYKFDKWYDMIWMEKCIANHKDKPNDIIPYPMLNK